MPPASRNKEGVAGVQGDNVGCGGGQLRVVLQAWTWEPGTAVYARFLIRDACGTEHPRLALGEKHPTLSAQHLHYEIAAISVDVARCIGTC